MKIIYHYSNLLKAPHLIETYLYIVTIIRIYIKAILRIVVVEFLHTLYQLILKLARTDLYGHLTYYYNSYLY